MLGVVTRLIPRTPLRAVTTPRGSAALCALVLLAACSSGDTGGEVGDGEVGDRVPTTATTSTIAADDDTGRTTTGPAAELSGTSWRLIELVADHGARQGAEGAVPAVVGFDDGRVGGYDGVDIAEGTYTINGESISVALDEVSQLGPVDDPGAEQFLFVLLAEVDRWEIDDDGELVLQHTGGLLRFEPVGGGTVE